MRSLLLALSLCLSLAVKNSYADVKSPADNFGPLFQQVQLQKIFPDGKTFVDATPNDLPEKIMADYARLKPTTAEELKKFVAEHFQIPTAGAAPVLSSARAPLREHIFTLWTDLQRTPAIEVKNSSALALPETYIVPGGRFREVYYWDSYFTMLGLVEDGKNSLVASMLSNFESLIERYGHIPNGTRTYYLSRSQPPFFALMVKLAESNDKSVITKQVNSLKSEHNYWMAGKDCLSQSVNACARVVKMDDGTILNRYWDDRDTPRDESYAEDVATAAKADNKAEVYRHLRAGAESGWDFSSRWLKDPQKIQSIHTTDIVPVDLNSLLWFQEKEIAVLCNKLSDKVCVEDFEKQASNRSIAIHKYLWLASEKRFADFDMKEKRPTEILSAATLYPLFVGLATRAEAKAVAETTEKKLVAMGGLRTTQISTGQQWDAPNGWAPLQWIAVSGLNNYGETKLAKDIAKRWLKTVNVAYQETGKLLEKYDIEQRRPGGGGEYPLQDGFGWTNGVTRAFMARYPELESN